MQHYASHTQFSHIQNHGMLLYMQNNIESRNIWRTTYFLSTKVFCNSFLINPFEIESLCQPDMGTHGGHVDLKLCLRESHFRTDLGLIEVT